MHLNNINYLIRNGELQSLRFEIHQASNFDVERIEKILDLYLKKRLKGILIEKKKQSYKEGILKRKIENILYLKRKILKPGNYALLTSKNDILKNYYLSFKSKKALKGNYVSLYRLPKK